MDILTLGLPKEIRVNTEIIWNWIVKMYSKNFQISAFLSNVQHFSDLHTYQANRLQNFSSNCWLPLSLHR